MCPLNSVFDRSAVRIHRDRAAPKHWQSLGQSLGQDNFLLNEAVERLADRLNDIKRQFPLALDLGCHGGQLKSRLQSLGEIKTLVQCDLSLAMARQAKGLRLAADEERLPFASQTFDLIISCLSLHWVNDLPGALIQARLALKPGGLLLASMLGGETLCELRRALALAEESLARLESQRVSPFIDVKMAGDLLLRAGFALPVSDSDTVAILYPGPLELMADLRAMGESNAAASRPRTFTGRAIMMEAVKRYQELYGRQDGRVAATFEIITLTAFAPSP